MTAEEARNFHEYTVARTAKRRVINTGHGWTEEYTQMASYKGYSIEKYVLKYKGHKKEQSFSAYWGNLEDEQYFDTKETLAELKESIDR